MIRIRIVIPGVVLRTGLKAVLSQIPDFVVLEEPADASGWSEQAAVWVVTFQGENQAALLADLAEQDLAPAVLAISENLLDLRVLAQLPLPAWGVLQLDAEPDVLEAALRALAAGLVVGAPEQFANIAVTSTVLGAEDAADMVETLTERELEVLDLLSRGLANKQIAAALQISDHTVKFHVASICGKLAAANRTEAVRLGLQYGLISL